MRKCPATQETNHLFKLNFTLEYYESDLSKVSIKFLSFVSPLNWVSFFRFWPKTGYQFSSVSSLKRARIWDPGRYTPIRNSWECPPHEESTSPEISEVNISEENNFFLFYRLGSVFPRLQNNVRLLSYAKPILRKKRDFFAVYLSGIILYLFPGFLRCPRMLPVLGFISDRFVSPC